VDEAGRLDPKQANVLYHDAVARTYEDKWAISFDQRCMSYVRNRAAWMLPSRRYRRVLEVGAGTGFFLLNLWQSGYVGEAHATDLSPGMLAVCAENARRIGCDLRIRMADAEALPYPDGEFDLVVGHAILHHLPQPGTALAEAFRVLAPGGAVLFAGEPTVRGDRRARAVGRATARLVRAASRAVPALRPPPPSSLSAQDRLIRDLEWDVDLHTFDPAAVAGLAREVGFTSVRVETEELIASVWGWAIRTIESMVPPARSSWGWATLAYRTWLALSAVDRRALYPVLPTSWFYNLLLYGERDG
jgi:ubiquinone/menaquinone biosynthesis C-methylase UbiE